MAVMQANPSVSLPRWAVFFEAWLGGNPRYFDAGWPLGLQAAHASVSISKGMAERWLEHFLASLSEATKDPKLVPQLKPYISRLARMLVSRENEPKPKERSRDISDSQFLRSLQSDDAAGLAEAASANPHVLPVHGAKLLLVAVLRGKLRAIEELLRQGVDVNRVAMPPSSDAKLHRLPNLRMSPLCAALGSHREAIAKLLIEHGAQYDIFTASCLGDFAAVRELLDLAPELADASDPACDVAHVTPLMHAVFAGQFEVAELLLERDATVGENSVRLIRAAANLGHEALTNLLVDNGANPLAIGAGTWVLYPAIAEKLLALGANVNYEASAWIGLCCTGNSGHKENPELVQAMLRCGAEINAVYKGHTALHCAVKAGFLNVATILLEHGAKVNALNEWGETPLDELENAKKSLNKEAIRRLLIAHGA